MVSIIIRARARAFTGRGLEKLRFLVEPDDVLAWDDVGGQFTRCNILSDDTKRRIRRLAAAKKAQGFQSE